MPTLAAARAAASFTPSPTITTGPAGRGRADGGQLALRRDSAQGIGRLDPQLPPDGRHYLGMVAREDADLPAQSSQPIQRVGGVGPEGIAQPRHRHGAAIDRHQHGRGLRGDGLALGGLDFGGTWQS